MSPGNDLPGPVSDQSGESTIGVSQKNRENASPTSTALSVGEQLRSAREANGLSTTDVARALKLSLTQVEALEADDWASLPGKTIIRGFVRNYARVLGLDAGQLMSNLDGLILPQAPELKMSAGTPVRFSQENKTERHDYVRVVSGVVILVLAVLAYFLVPPELWQSTLTAIRNVTQSRDVTAEKESMPSKPAVEQPLGKVVVPLETSVIPDNKVIAIQNPLEPAVLPPSVAAPAPKPEREPEVAPAPVADVALNFSFKQAAWLEVRDHTGKVIFSQLNQAGTQRIVEGVPPYSLTIGNASHVVLRYKGETVDLAKRSKDDVARLSLE